MKASDLFIKQLEEEGGQYIFALPGEENLDLMESLYRSSIKRIVTRHEQESDFMAATYGRLTGRARSCLSTLGPGNDPECRIISTINSLWLFTRHRIWRFFK